MDNENKIIFDKETTEKLQNISIKVMRLLYSELEKLELGENEKIMAHYYIVKNYYDGVQNAMNETGFYDVKIKKVIENEKKEVKEEESKKSIF